MCARTLQSSMQIHGAVDATRGCRFQPPPKTLFKPAVIASVLGREAHEVLLQVTSHFTAVGEEAEA